MALKTILSEVCDTFTESGSVDTIWRAIPTIMAELRLEFENRLGITPEFQDVRLILALLDPQLAYGTNIIVFETYFPSHSGLRIRCECCLEHPNAKVSVRKQPDDDVGSATIAVRLINSNCIGNTFEANLLNISNSH